MILDIVTDTFANVDEILQDLQINDEKFDITSGSVTVTDAVSFALVKETSETLIELNTTGTLTLNSIKDTFDNVIAVDSLTEDFDQQITMSDASVQVIDTVNLNQITELRNDTTGDITVDIISDSKINL